MPQNDMPQNDMPQYANLHRPSTRLLTLILLALLCGGPATPTRPALGEAPATDWPRWRGPEGRGVWNLPGPSTIDLHQGVTEVWRKPISPGYSGIAVTAGRLYTQDRPPEPEQHERVLCLDSDSGQLIWEYLYEADYTDLDYDKGPRATPLVDEGRVYILGAVGHFACLDATSGQVLWRHDLKQDWQARQPMWGFAASPIRHGELIIVHPGAADGCFMAFHHERGELAWKSGSDSCGYATPIVVEHSGSKQLIGWTPEHIVSLDPATGQSLWRIPYPVTYGVSIATPLFRQGIVLVAGYWEGSKAIRLGNNPQEAELIWEENRQLRGLMADPLYRDGHVYLLDKRFGIVCFELASGTVRWTDENQLTPEDRNPQASLVWIGESDEVIALNALGELVHARFQPDGYEELGRTRVTGETWAHPAYVGRDVYARDDETIVRVQVPLERETK